MVLSRGLSVQILSQELRSLKRVVDSTASVGLVVMCLLMRMKVG